MASFVDFATLSRPKTPNTYLLAPSGLCQAATPDGEAPVFPLPAQDVYFALESLIERDGRAGSLERDEGSLSLKYVATTALLRFKDDIDIQVLSEESGSTLAIYSRSRIGRSDLGANRKRVEALLGSLTNVVAMLSGVSGSST